MQKKTWLLYLILTIILIPMLACQLVDDLLTFSPEASSVPLLTQYAITPTPQTREHSQNNPANTPLASEALSTVAPTPTYVPQNKQDQAEIFNDIWSTVNQEYLYEDFNGIDWDQIKETYLQKIQEGLTTDEFYYAMAEMIYELGDQHSYFMDPQVVYEDNLEYAGENDYVGIGVWHRIVAEEGYTTILVTFPDSPAEKAGLKPHDNILSIDGQAIVDDDGRFREEIILGEPGSTLQIVVQTPGDAPRELTIERQRVNSSMPVPAASFTSPNGQNIGYLILPSVYDLTIPESFLNAYQSLTQDGNLDGLIIDNRVNGGGSDYIAKQVMRLFTDGLLGYYVNRDDKEAFTVRGKDVDGSQTIPLVVLVGENSVSFGEIMPAILQDLGRATIIGETTLGNVEVLYGYDFQDGSQLWLAHDTFQTAVNFDRNWEDTGVIPDIEAPADWDKISLFTDPAILAALDYFDCAQTSTATCY